jgi:hypothetical protein
MYLNITLLCSSTDPMIDAVVEGLLNFIFLVGLFAIYIYMVMDGRR